MPSVRVLWPNRELRDWRHRSRFANRRARDGTTARGLRQSLPRLVRPTRAAPLG